MERKTGIERLKEDKELTKYTISFFILMIFILSFLVTIM
jgi:hypothetical protein